jgi:FtsP/CotA-like multicopper oxidase with cupredoxin domain
MDLMHGRIGPNTLVNGILLPTFKARGSSVERLRIINSCVSQYQSISVPGVEMWKVSSDSSRLSKLEKTTSITLTPGQRSEVLVAAPKAGTFTIQNDFQSLAKLIFNEKTRELASSSLLPYSPIRKVDRKRTITVKGSGMGMMSGMRHEDSFTFDGKAFNSKRIDQSVKFGSVEEWTISNPSSMEHPFHLHTWPFQVTNDGRGKSLQGWHDTVNLPPKGVVKIRIPFVGIKGTTVYHCHILDHEDAGMMGIIKVS